jgi:NAD(P)-dependent dehydrogenase (short-subunit alcohol dehydrogenase family)
MQELRGKVAVVTGSGSGLGRGMAERFAREGMTVVVADRRLDAAQETVGLVESAGGAALAAEVDVTDRAAVVALADRVDAELGGAHVLVNNAGVISYSPLLEDEEQGWRWIVDVNLFGVVHGIQAFLPRMLERGEEGHVVNVASMAGVVGGGGVRANRITVGDGKAEFGAMYGYMATKTAIVGLTESLAGDLSGTPIGLSVLCPSHHDATHIFENSRVHRPESAGGPMSDAEYQAVDGNTAAKRKETFGQTRLDRTPEECAARVVRAIREGHFYVFTHPETRVAIEHRFSNLLAGFDDATDFAG